MRSTAILFLITLIPFVLSAQKKHETTDRIHSLNWDIIGNVKFDMDEDFNISPIFTESIKRFKDKPFELTGYLIPLKPGRSHDRFLLSALPINQCYYCGKNGIPVMILVTAKKPISYLEKPIKLTGILKLDQNKGEAPITLAEAELL